MSAARRAPRNGFDVTDVVYNTRSSIRRVSEHHIVSDEVCNGQDPARSTLYGRDLDKSIPGTPVNVFVHSACGRPY